VLTSSLYLFTLWLLHFCVIHGDILVSRQTEIATHLRSNSSSWPGQISITLPFAA